MTTIAWDGKTLAVDRQLTSSGVRYTTTKAHRLKDGSLFASCGEVELNAAVRAWLNGDGDKPTIGKDDDFDAVIVRRTGVFMLNKRLVPIPVEDKCWATGSGRDFALMAMRIGKTAREAVLAAAEMDIWTGMGITELTLDDA